MGVPGYGGKGVDKGVDGGGREGNPTLEGGEGGNARDLKMGCPPRALSEVATHPCSLVTFVPAVSVAFCARPPITGAFNWARFPRMLTSYRRPFSLMPLPSAEYSRSRLMRTPINFPRCMLCCPAPNRQAPTSVRVTRASRMRWWRRPGGMLGCCRLG